MCLYAFTLHISYHIFICDLVWCKYNPDPQHAQGDQVETGSKWYIFINTEKFHFWKPCGVHLFFWMRVVIYLLSQLGLRTKNMSKSLMPHKKHVSPKCQLLGYFHTCSLFSWSESVDEFVNVERFPSGLFWFHTGTNLNAVAREQENKHCAKDMFHTSMYICAVKLLLHWVRKICC